MLFSSRTISVLEENSMRTVKRQGFTLIELIIVVAIIGLLMSLMFPAVQAMRESARRLQCINNLHNLGTAYQNLATRNPQEPAMSAPYVWVSKLKEEIEDSDETLLCPNDLNPNATPLPDLVFHVRNNGYNVPFDPTGPRCRVSEWVHKRYPVEKYPGRFGLEHEEQGIPWPLGKLYFLEFNTRLPQRAGCSFFHQARLIIREPPGVIADTKSACIHRCIAMQGLAHGAWISEARSVDGRQYRRRVGRVAYDRTDLVE